MERKIKNLRFVAALMLLLASANANAQLLKGTLKADSVPDMLITYSPDGSMLNIVQVEIEPDKNGNFSFDGPLPIDAVDITLGVDNDIFGVHLEKGKQATVAVKANKDKPGFTAELGGDNKGVSQFYNAYVQGYDVMKYFSPDPAEAKPNAEYRQTLEDEYAKVKKALNFVKNKEQRDYYEKLSAGMYKWSKIRLIMDLAEDENKQFSDYPEYNELVSTINPNDYISVPTNLVFFVAELTGSNQLHWRPDGQLH